MGDLKDLNIRPGLYTIDTDRGSKGRWKDGQWVRFFLGMPEKMGGYAKIGSTTFVGICRALIDWVSLIQSRIIGVGTNKKLYAWTSNVYTDITPLETSGTLGLNPITTTNGSTSVNIQDTAHARLVGDYVTFGGATAVGGITVDGEYTVTTVVDADNYTITHSAAATSGATGGGAAVTYAYQIHIGSADSVAGLGWGAGTYGTSTYGTARSTSSFLNLARIWSLANWGEDLIACPRELGIYLWDRSVGGRAAAISGAPSTARAIFVTDENRTLVALGAHDGSADDPMLIRWCDEEDYSTWTADEDNTAGEKRLDAGSELYCRVPGRNENVIFSDTFAWSMRFIGPPYTFGFDEIGRNGGLRGPNAATSLQGIVYWMGKGQFYFYDGRIKVLPCEVLNRVFDSFNESQRAKVFAGVNVKFGEVWWLYPSADATECDRFVIYNANEGHWVFGNLARTAMIGDSKTFTLPYMAGTDGYLYDHETGTDGDTLAIASYIESADVEVDDGSVMLLIRKLVPDFERIAGSLAVTMRAKKYPHATASVTKSVGTITPTKAFLNPRIKGRQVSIRLDTTSTGDDWRMGKLRIDAKPYGKR